MCGQPSCCHGPDHGALRTGQSIRPRMAWRAGAGPFLSKEHRMWLISPALLPPSLPLPKASHLTFCRVCGGSSVHWPKTGPWSLVVSRSSWARSSCSSSGTMRKLPTWADSSQGEAATTLISLGEPGRRASSALKLVLLPKVSIKPLPFGWGSGTTEGL